MPKSNKDYSLLPMSGVSWTSMTLRKITLKYDGIGLFFSDNMYIQSN